MILGRKQSWLNRLNKTGNQTNKTEVIADFLFIPFPIFFLFKNPISVCSFELILKLSERDLFQFFTVFPQNFNSQNFSLGSPCVSLCMSVCVYFSVCISALSFKKFLTVCLFFSFTLFCVSLSLSPLSDVLSLYPLSLNVPPFYKPQHQTFYSLLN